MKLYEFTVSDALGLSLSAIDEIAISGAAHQEDFEIQMGGPEWGKNWKVNLVNVEFSSSGRRFHFDVIQQHPEIPEVTWVEEMDHLQEALENREAELEMVDYVADKWKEGDILESLLTVENFHDGI